MLLLTYEYISALVDKKEGYSVLFGFLNVLDKVFLGIMLFGTRMKLAPKPNYTKVFFFMKPRTALSG